MVMKGYQGTAPIPYFSISPLTMIGISTAALILLTQAPNLTEGFGIVSTSSLQKQTAFSSSTFNVQPRSFVLYATEDQVEGEEAVEEVEAEITDDEPKSSDDDTEEEDKETDENDEPEEDPEVTAIKKEISELESKLKQKNRDLDSLEKLTEQYTRGGYARKVAEMEGFRKSRNVSFSFQTCVFNYCFDCPLLI